MKDGVICSSCGEQLVIQSECYEGTGRAQATCSQCGAGVYHQTDPTDQPKRESMPIVGEIVKVRTRHCDYLGTFVEMTEEDIKIKGALGWIVLPVDQVVSVRWLHDEPDELDDTKQIEATFYAETD